MGNVVSLLTFWKSYRHARDNWTTHYLLCPSKILQLRRNCPYVSAVTLNVWEESVALPSSQSKHVFTKLTPRCLHERSFAFQVQLSHQSWGYWLNFTGLTRGAVNLFQWSHPFCEFSCFWFCLNLLMNWRTIEKSWVSKFLLSVSI